MGSRRTPLASVLFEFGLIRWYVLEGQPKGNDFTLFCIVVGIAETEYGYASVKEMEGIKVAGSRYGLDILSIRQILDFKPCPIAEIQDKRLRTSCQGYMMSSNERLCKREPWKLAFKWPSAAKRYRIGEASAYLFFVGHIYFGCLFCLICHKHIKCWYK